MEAELNILTLALSVLLVGMLVFLVVLYMNMRKVFKRIDTISEHLPATQKKVNTLTTEVRRLTDEVSTVRIDDDHVVETIYDLPFNNAPLRVIRSKQRQRGNITRVASHRR